MAKKSWILTDAGDGTFVEQLSIGPGDVAGSPAGWSVKKQTLRGGRQDGVDVVEVDNGSLRFVVIPTRGMGIWRAWSGQRMLGWKSPVRGPVHPAYVPLSEPSGLGWLDGFDELLVRCGLESNGAPDFDERGILTYPLHGRAANLPAQRVEVEVDGDAGEITIRGVVEETRFHFQKLRLTAAVTTRLGQAGFQIHDQVTNFGGTPAGLQMLYHVNFGVPLLDAGAKVVAPVKTLVPRNDHAAGEVANWDSYPAEQPGSEERVFFFELVGDEEGNTRTLLKNAHATEGVSLRFNKKQLPCFTQWKNTPAVADGYVTGLEPGTNFPNPRSYEAQQKRVIELAPGATRKFDLTLDWHLDEDQVAVAEKEIAVLAEGTEPQIYDKPQPRWCAS